MIVVMVMCNQQEKVQVKRNIKAGVYLCKILPLYLVFSFLISLF